MHDDTEDIEILMAKLFAGEADGEEIAAIEAWRKKDPANEAMFQQSRKLMETLSVDQFRPEVDTAWKKVEERISRPEAKTISLFNTRNVFRAAAAILVLIAGAFLLNTYLSKPSDTAIEPVQIAAGKTPREEKLPDGSTVVVSRNSKLEFSKDEKGQRVARLKGEAFFEVVHNEEEPFIVTTGNVFIKDIGTAFNVRTDESTGNTEVFVESGEVQFYTSSSDGIKLVKGEHGMYDKMSGVFTKALVEGLQNMNSYRTRSFTFRESRLEDVLVQVNTVYGSHLITGNPSINDCRLSVSFNNEPIEVIVDVITQTLDLDAKQSGDTLILTGKGCNE